MTRGSHGAMRELSGRASRRWYRCGLAGVHQWAGTVLGGLCRPVKVPGLCSCLHSDGGGTMQNKTKKPKTGTCRYLWFQREMQQALLFGRPHTASQWISLCMEPSEIPLPTAGHCIAMCPCVLPLSLWSLYHLLCRSCLVSPPFFFRHRSGHSSTHRVDCSVCRLGVSVGRSWGQGLPAWPSWTRPPDF